MKEKIMYRYTLPGSNAARRSQETIREVKVTVGRKYLTDGNGCRYDKTAVVGDFGIPCYSLVTVYCNDFCLFETRENAERRAQGDLLLKKIHRVQFKSLPVDLLAQIVRYDEANRKECNSTK